MKYVENLINDEYLRWNVGEKVLISSQTGSGKTTFILKKLLPYAISQNKKIVYFCNRRILRDQLDVEAEKQLKICFGNDVELSAEEMKYINITTYQSCEIAENFKCYPKTLRFKKQQDNVEIKHDEVLYYVFDEAHYFTEDALFNPETNYWDMDIFKNGISVFLTATPEPLRLFLSSQLKATLSNVNSGLWLNIDAMCKRIREEQSFNPLFDYVSSARAAQIFHHEYVDENDYGYIDAKYFHTYDDIFSRIKSSKDKWLIFVDRENDGIVLCERLKSERISSAVLSAERLKKKKSDGYRELTNIVLNHQFDCQVLISTSVMDCGLKTVYLFGSYARGTANESSDIDLLIDTSGAGLTSLFKLAPLYNDLDEAFDKEIDMVMVSTLEQPARMASDVLFREEIEKDRRVIYAVA